MGASKSRSDASVVEDLVDKALSLKPAPAPLHHVQLLLNTRNLLGGYDLLTDEETVRQCLALIAERGGNNAPSDCDEDSLTSLVHMREAVRGLLRAHAAGEHPDHETRDAVRTAGARVRLSVDLDALGNPIVLPPNDSHGIDRITATVMAAIASAGPDQLQRLKACVNPDCGWVFYDTSRSRSGTWCAMNVCGARHKMERYRRRQH